MTHSDQAEVALEPSPAIWNPNAAANWCLLFTPAFGAYLNMLNWRALGESEREAASRKWFYFSIGLMVFYVLLALLVGNEKASEGITRLIAFVFLLTWYFSSGRTQAKYVKERFGNDYLRKPWGKALGYGIGGLLGYFLLSFIVGMLMYFVM